MGLAGWDHLGKEFGSVRSNRSFCSDGNVLCPCCPPATLAYWALEMWLVWWRNWTFISFQLFFPWTIFILTKFRVKGKKTDIQQGPTVQHRELCLIFCNNLNGKRVWKRTDTHICITESLCCTLETNTTLSINYTPT